MTVLMNAFVLLELVNWCCSTLVLVLSWLLTCNFDLRMVLNRSDFSMTSAGVLVFILVVNVVDASRAVERTLRMTATSFRMLATALCACLGTWPLRIKLISVFSVMAITPVMAFRLTNTLFT